MSMKLRARPAPPGQLAIALAALFLLTVALAGTSPLAAQAPEAKPARAAELAVLPLEDLLELEISTASRFPQRISEAPSAVRVIHADEIRAHGWRTLAEALASLPGTYTSYDRSYVYLGARGFLRPGDYVSRFLLLVDGQRYNDPIYGQAALGNDFPVDIDLVERIEYIPGPGSAVYGSNAYFGVINVITRWPQADRKSEIALHAGSFGVRDLAGSIGWTDDSGAAVLVAASEQRRSGEDLYFPEFDDGEGGDGIAAGLDGERVRRALVKARRDGWQLVLSHGRRHKQTPTAAFDQVFAAPGAHVVDERSLLHLDHTRTLGPATELSAQLAYGRYDYYGDYIYDNPPIVVNHDGARARWLALESRLLSRAVDRHTIVLGVELQHDLRRDQYNFDREPREVYLDDRRSGSRIGVFVEDEFVLVPGLLLNTGLRYDHDRSGGGEFSPRLALIANRDRAHAKLVVGRAFRSPNTYEQHYWQESPFGLPADASLRSETIETIELMVNRRFGHGTTIGALMYRYRLDNLITQVEDMDTGLLGFRNLGAADASGMELSLDQRWSGGATLRASYALARVDSTYEGRQTTNSPRNVFKLNAVVPVWQERALLALEARRVGSRYARLDSVPGYGVVDIGLRFPALAGRLDLFLGIDNLLDRRYADPVDVEFRQNAIEQDGRGYRIRLGYRF